MENSKWIWISDESKINEYVEFLTSFIYKNGISEIKISVDTEYALYINGKFVNSGQYADFPWYKVYDRVDITEYLHEGENEVRIIGWFMGDVTFCHYLNRPGLRFEVSIDGKTVVSSSKETICRIYPHFLSGERVKKINNQLGRSFIWQQGEQNDFLPAVEVSGMPEELIERPIKNLTVSEKLPAKPISAYVYDLGAEALGYPYLEIRAPRGVRVNIAFGEWLSEEGHVMRIHSYYDFSFEIDGTGEWVKVFNPLRKLGCRYFEISGSCEIREIALYPVKYPFEEKKAIIEGERRKEIYEVSVKTLLLNALDHYYDCPWREQAFWTFDARFQMRYGYAAFNGTDYQRAALALLSEDRREDNLITMVVPSSTKNTIPSFALSYIMAMAEYAEETGDLSLAIKYFDKLKSVADAYVGRAENGIIPCFEGIWNFYEWKPMFDGHSGRRIDSVLNLMVCFALKKLIYICDKLGKKEDLYYYSSQLNEIIKAVRERFFVKETGLFKSFDDIDAYSQLVNSLAILSGAVDEKEAERICEMLISPDETVTTTTLSMTAFKYDALIAVNKEKYSDFILGDIDESFGGMLDKGATAFWETLLGKDDMNGGGSLCHGWSALPTYYYKVLGVMREM
ncbi:MAG: family 78 glycoside hydrolase catalytic domain [Clostridia bacterium]|nr:family 78 glycoside hydrolase catalytic domain [Clostridia bacterium]